MVNPSRPKCELCGAPAIVHITHEDHQGVLVRHLCLSCADGEQRALHTWNRGVDRAAVLAVMGVLVLIISIFADRLGFGRSPGFDWKQEAGVVLAALLLLTGALIRVPTLSVCGLLAGGVTILADRIGFGDSPGFGWQQVAGSVLGVVLLVWSFLMYQARR